jgi:hypothetical protein
VCRYFEHYLKTRFGAAWNARFQRFGARSVQKAWKCTTYEYALAKLGASSDNGSSTKLPESQHFWARHVTELLHRKLIAVFLAAWFGLLAVQNQPAIADDKEVDGEKGQASTEPSDGAEKKIADLIARLDADTFAERRRAYLVLRAFGPLAIEQLRDAASKGDPEIITHAVELMEGWSLDADSRVFEPAARALQDLTNSSNGELARRSDLAHRRHRRHRRSLAQSLIQELGGAVTINPGGRNREIVYVQLTQNWKGGEDLSPLLELGPLQNLVLSSPIFTDATLKQIGKFEDVRSLSLHKGRFTKSGFSALRDLNSLQSLNLGYLVETEHLGESLQGFEALNQLSLQSMDLSKTDFSQLKDLALRNLTLNQCELHDDSLTFIEGMQSLYYVNFQDMNVSAKNVASIAKAPGLSHLNLRKVPLDTEKLAPIKGAPVTMISLYTTDVTGKALEPLAELESLTRLTLHETKLNDKDLTTLKKFKKLQYLILQNTKISASGGKELTEAVKPCRVSISPRK